MMYRILITTIVVTPYGCSCHTAAVEFDKVEDAMMAIAAVNSGPSHERVAQKAIPLF